VVYKGIAQILRIKYEIKNIISICSQSNTKINTFFNLMDTL